MWTAHRKDPGPEICLCEISDLKKTKNQTKKQIQGWMELCNEGLLPIPFLLLIVNAEAKVH